MYKKDILVWSKKRVVTPRTEYKLTINKPSALGFLSTEGDLGNNRINDIILAMNLTLTEAALSSEGKTLYKPTTIIPTNERNNEHIIKVDLEREQQQKQQVYEKVTISETVGVVLGRAQQQLDESNVISNLQLIDKADRHTKNHQGNSAKHNLAKALNDYEKAFNRTKGEEIFKDIFNAVEEAINWNKPPPGWNPDNELSSVANIAPNKAAQWRCIYNRLKHPDYGKQLKDYQTAKNEVPNELVPLRRAASTVILQRLNLL
jgi:hypothetical protein